MKKESPKLFESSFSYSFLYIYIIGSFYFEKFSSPKRLNLFETPSIEQSEFEILDSLEPKLEDFSSS